MSPRIAVLGVGGRMGRRVVAEIVHRGDLALVAGVVRTGSSVVGEDLGILAGSKPMGVVARGVGPDCFGDADVVIDFSLPEGVVAALPHLGARALVTGTTGLSAGEEARRDAHAVRGPLLVAANFSLGIHVLTDLVRRAVAALPDADIEIVEVHHRDKRDAPSGTARALADAAARVRGLPPGDASVVARHGAVGPRPATEIGIHAIRGGDVSGDHTVWLLADGERLALSHRSSGRHNFARGAVRAAAWLAGRPAGSYTLSDVLDGV